MTLIAIGGQVKCEPLRHSLAPSFSSVLTCFFSTGTLSWWSAGGTVCITGTCGDVFCHFFTIWPNYPRQFSVMQQYLIWKVYQMFHEIIMSGVFFFFTIQLIIIPWTLDIPRPCLKVEFVMLEAGRLAALLTSLESLAFQWGQRWRAAAPLSEGKVSELTGDVKRVMKFALLGFLSPLN